MNVFLKMIVIYSFLFICFGCNEKNVSTPIVLEKEKDEIQLKIQTQKSIYSSKEHVEIESSLMYKGDEEFIKISHASPPVYFEIYDDEGKLILSNVVSAIEEDTTLYQGTPLYFKMESLFPPRGFTDSEIIKDEVFLPRGKYIVKVVGDYTVYPSTESSRITIETEIAVK